MVAVLHEGYWTDLGTEEKLLAAEKDLPLFFKG
jgi:NDP-sugar pyrophosphorylase family protein